MTGGASITEHKGTFIIDRKLKDRLANKIMFIPAMIMGLFLVIMVIVLFLKSEDVLALIPLNDLLFSSVWQPMSGKFGFYPFIIGTIWVTALAMLLSIPVSLLSAVYLSEYAHKKVRFVIQPLVDLLAGIPSVVYGLFGILLIVPLIRDYIAPMAGYSSSGYCVLAGGIILAIMVFPILISIIYEVIKTVPAEMREASLALGATHWETIKKVVIRRAYPGIFAAIILGFSRAFGETMAVLMVVGNVPMVPTSVFDPAYPIPALIANNYGEMMSIPIYDSALMFAALLLLIMVVFFNIIAKYVLLKIKKRVI